MDKIQKSQNITQTEKQITLKARELYCGHKPAVVWFVGLPSSGKSTIACELEKCLFKQGVLVYSFDGDDIRHGLNKDLGFSINDREENLRRIAEVAKLYNLSGGIAITACISPFEKARKKVREIIGENFIQVYLDVPLEICIKRDTKGLYKKAIEGKIKDFTGISSPFEIPNNSEIIIDTSKYTPEESAKIIIDYLKNKKIIK